MIKPTVFPIPVNYFSISLGLLSLGLAWRGAANVLPDTSALIGEGILAAGGITWSLFLGIYVYKWLCCKDSAQRELQDIIQCCFIVTAQ